MPKTTIPELVKYIGADNHQVRWGGNDDPRDLFTISMYYIVARKEVHSWHTKLELLGYKGKAFNSVSFEPY